MSEKLMSKNSQLIYFDETQNSIKIFYPTQKINKIFLLFINWKVEKLKSGLNDIQAFRGDGS